MSLEFTMYCTVLGSQRRFNPGNSHCLSFAWITLRLLPLLTTARANRSGVYPMAQLLLPHENNTTPSVTTATSSNPFKYYHTFEVPTIYHVKQRGKFSVPAIRLTDQLTTCRLYKCQSTFRSGFRKSTAFRPTLWLLNLHISVVLL